MKGRNLLMIPGPIEFTLEVMRAVGMPTMSLVVPDFVEVSGQGPKELHSPADVWRRA